MNKSRIVRDVLKFRYRDSKRAVFWLKNEKMIPVVRLAWSAIDQCNEPVSRHNVEILKHYAGKRLIFRINSSQFAEKSFVVKVFSLRFLKQRLKYHIMKNHRYAFSEAANLVIAAGRGLSVPKVYGYGRVYDSAWLINKDMVILEDLAHLTSVDELLRLNRGDDKKCAKILSQTIPVFVSLYKAKCNIVYILSDAIMFSGEDSEQDAFVLDFEYARFYDQPSLEVLMYEAAYFAVSCPDWLAHRIINDWVTKLLDAVGIRDNADRKKLMERFKYYFHIPYMSHKESVEIY